jgi:predicted nucleotide-binding protein
MTVLIEKIDNLIKQSDSFTWENSNYEDRSGVFGKEPSGAWNAWVTRIERVIKESVKQESEPFIYFKTGNATRIKGNFRDQFDTAKDSYVGALKALKSILEGGDTFDELLVKTNSVEKIEIVKDAKNQTSKLNEKKVFIVHGHDHNLKVELEVFLSHIGLKPIVLHREADEGKTIIEKFEANSDVAFVFILLTPDEIAYTIDQEKISELERKKEFRARPNVIFEFGYFVAKLGRNRVCALHKGNVSIPSDLSGFIYKRVDTNVEEIGYALIKELKTAGLKLDI